MTLFNWFAHIKLFDFNIDVLLCSFLCMPITAETDSSSKQVIGLISVQDEKDRGGFGKEEQNLLKVFCTQAAVTLVNARKFNKVIDEASSKQIDTSAAEYLMSMLWKGRESRGLYSKTGGAWSWYFFVVSMKTWQNCEINSRPQNKLKEILSSVTIRSVPIFYAAILQTYVNVFLSH